MKFIGINRKGSNARPVTAGKLRRGQLITTYGPGAIADFPDNRSVVMASIDSWPINNKNYRLNEPRLERLLGASYFIEPPAGADGADTGSDIPAWRFPHIGFCSTCHRLGPLTEIGFLEKGKYYCTACANNKKKNLLIPSRFVIACVNGHLADFPYGWWVHHPDMDSCANSWGGNLEITTTGKTGGLESIIIRCLSCNHSRSMYGCLGKDALKGFGCSGHRPWLGPNKDERCKAVPRTMLKGASGIWFPLTASALTLPSARARMQKFVADHWDDLKDIIENKDFSIEKKKEFADFVLRRELKDEQFSLDDVFAEALAKYGGENIENNGEYTVRNLHEDEYAVLSACGGKEDGEKSPEYHAQPAQIPATLLPYFDRVLLISRLREVMALYGFRRITPEEISKNNPAFPGYNLDKGYVPLGEMENGRPRTRWLPAVEMLGEGIFIQLREDALEEWTRRAHSRYDTMSENLGKSNVGCPNFSPRYVLLHTLAHLLIRQLALECGYSGASIKERIYSTYPDSKKAMAGIVLYTSSTDADGSLGGLVRNGQPDNLERIFFNMLREASWCSTDPVCAESHGQGFGALNYAACHACTLLPETSCAMRNCLLDRMAITGTQTSPETGFFHKLMHTQAI